MNGKILLCSLKISHILFQDNFKKIFNQVPTCFFFFSRIVIFSINYM
jgi:hypothetical protein